MPLVIGVVGHRHLEPHDYPLYHARVTGLFAYLRTRYPSTPLRVISALAEGADRLVAEVALAEGCELIVPLPMAAEEYARDFPDTAHEFRDLLARIPAANVFVLPDAAAMSPTATHAELRDAQYREVGVFIGDAVPSAPGTLGRRTQHRGRRHGGGGALQARGADTFRSPGT